MTTTTWVQVKDRSLGAFRGKGIFTKLLSKKLDPEGKLNLSSKRPEHKNSKENNRDSL